MEKPGLYLIRRIYTLSYVDRLLSQYQKLLFMKKIMFLVIGCGIILLNTGCNETGFRYVDISTGKRVNIVTDPATGIALDSVTKQPVTIYYDTQTRDTIFGKTGKVINNQVIKTATGYTYNEPVITATDTMNTTTAVKPKTQEQKDLELLNKYGKYKKKVSSDGDVKIVEGDKKIKVDGETGKKTVKDK